MLRLLLDEHLSPLIAKQIREHNPAMEIFSLQEWRNGLYIGQTDEHVLRAAHAARLTLVSYDHRTILSLLGCWAAEGVAHSGLIVVSGKTTAANNIGALVRALLHLWEIRGREEWTDRVFHLHQ